jgi:hypothetical protein
LEQQFLRWRHDNLLLEWVVHQIKGVKIGVGDFTSRKMGTRDLRAIFQDFIRYFSTLIEISKALGSVNPCID